MDSQEDFPYVVTRVGFVLTWKAVKHMRVGYTTLGLLLSNVPLFPLLLLLELDLSCRMEGEHNPDLYSYFVALHWSLYCYGLISKLHAVSAGGIVWMRLQVYCWLAKTFPYHPSKSVHSELLSAWRDSQSAFTFSFLGRY